MEWSFISVLYEVFVDVKAELCVLPNVNFLDDLLQLLKIQSRFENTLKKWSVYNKCSFVY